MCKVIVFHEEITAPAICVWRNNIEKYTSMFPTIKSTHEGFMKLWRLMKIKTHLTY